MSDVSSDWRGRRVLITGASGFIGSRLVERLRPTGAELCLVSREPRSTAAPNLHWRQCDLTDGDGVRSLAADFQPDLLIHLASLVSGSRDRELVLPMLQNNLLSAVHLLNAAADYGARCVLAGSMEEPSPNDPGAAPGSPYAAAKWAATGYAGLFHSLYDVSAVTLRIFMVYGPGQSDRRKLTPYVCEALLRGESPALSSGGRPVDWVFVDDVVDAVLMAAKRTNLAGETLDIGSGAATTVREFAERIGRLVDPDIPLRFGAIADRPLETTHIADVERTRAKLGWQPAVPLEEGLRRTVAWYRLQAHLAAPA